MRKRKQENTVPETEICRNCKYFLRHYAKSAGGFKALMEGHCICRNSRYKIKAREIYDKNCGFWESNEEINEKLKQSIVETLRYMAEQVEELAVILKEMQ